MTTSQSASMNARELQKAFRERFGYDHPVFEPLVRLSEEAILKNLRDASAEFDERGRSVRFAVIKSLDVALRYLTLKLPTDHLTIGAAGLPMRLSS